MAWFLKKSCGCNYPFSSELVMSVSGLHSYEVLQLLDRETNPHGPILYYIFNTLLISLFILHIYWWVLMWRMIVKQVQDWGKISDDIRSGTFAIPWSFSFWFCILSLLWLLYMRFILANCQLHSTCFLLTLYLVLWFSKELKPWHEDRQKLFSFFFVCWKQGYARLCFNLGMLDDILLSLSPI